MWIIKNKANDEPASWTLFSILHLIFKESVYTMYWIRDDGALFLFYSLVDDRCVVQPDAGDLTNPPKKFRGILSILNN